MNYFGVGLLAVALLLAGGCGGFGWRDHHSDDGRFSVAMPEQPDLQSYDAATPSGVLPVHDLSAGDDSAFYQVVWLDLPAYLADSAAPESFLGEAERWGDEGAVSLPDSMLSLKEHPGRAFLGREPDGSLRKVQLYADRGRLYQLVAVGRASTVAGTGGDRFFRSFSIDD